MVTVGQVLCGPLSAACRAAQTVQACLHGLMGWTGLCSACCLGVLPVASGAGGAELCTWARPPLTCLLFPQGTAPGAWTADSYTLESMTRATTPSSPRLSPSHPMGPRHSDRTPWCLPTHGYVNAVNAIPCWQITSKLCLWCSNSKTWLCLVCKTFLGCHGGQSCLPTLWLSPARGPRRLGTAGQGREAERGEQAGPAGVSLGIFAPPFLSFACSRNFLLTLFYRAGL